MSRLLACLLLCAACHEAPAAADLPATADAMRPGDQAAAADLSTAADDQAPQCRSDKMTFTRERGCENDGSVEFCLPAGDAALLAQVKDLAPTVRCAAGGGRAGCDPGRELLCFFPTGMTECTARYGALTDAAWATLCRLAALPEVRRIVPTWFE